MRALFYAAALTLGILPTAFATDRPPPANEIFDRLIKNGVPRSNEAAEKLPKPVMADGLNAAAQEKVIAGLVATAHLPEFRRGGLSDRFEHKITGEPAKKAGQIGTRHLDVYYIANGKLETVNDKNFVKQVMGAGGPNFHFLTTAELSKRMIALPDDRETKRERIGHAMLDLFNMVKVRATGDGIATSQTDSQLTAFALDDRFNEDQEFPNEYQVISMAPGVGRKVLSDPAIYRGAGGYFKITRLDSKTPQLFIEYHLIFEEPYEWFKGQGTLTSKLPEKVLADVRSFRRDLQKWERANPSAPGAANVPAAEKK